MDRLGERAVVWLAEQQVNVFGHDNVSVDAHVEVMTHGLKAKWEQVVNCGTDEIGLAAITTEGDEMRLSGFLKPAQASGHEHNLHPRAFRVQ